ncbi:MAG: acetate--CoA ligase family protein [Hyphomicrobiaceae bacterium]
MLKPRSIAIAGISQKGGSLGGTVLANLERFGFKGDVHLVHPSAAEIAGRRAVTSTAALPKGIDCAILAIPTSAVTEAVRGCAASGVGSVIIFSAGFAEAGEGGRQRQAELASIARNAGMAAAGPNCLGHINFVDGISLSFSVAEIRRPNGPALAVISQSGAMASVVRAALHAHDLDISYTVSTGNEVVSGVEDFLAFMIDDPAVKAIALIVEQFRQPRRFLQLVDAARAAGKPIVLLHPGRSQAARESALTHTGAMTRNYEVMRTLVEHAGVAAVDTMEELVDVAELLVRCREVPSKGPIVLGESGAFKALALDQAETVGLELPMPEGATREVLETLAPGLILATNPVDLTAQPLVDPGLYRKALTPLLTDDRYGSVVIAPMLTSAQTAAHKAKPLLDTLKDTGVPKPVILAMLGDDVEVPADVITGFRTLGIPFFRSPDRALRALAAFTRLGRTREKRNAVTAPATPPEPALPPGIIAEHAAKQMLAAYGIPVPPGDMAATLDDARAIAQRIRYPVALKAQSEKLFHKSDIGGVILGLGSVGELADGWARLHDNIAHARPGLKLDGVLVERMAPQGLELIVGARNDPDWGPVLIVGLGGILAEALHDVRLLPPGIGQEQIIAEMHKLRGAALLGGVRGRPAVDVAAVADIISRLDRIMAAHPEIVEIDINPVLALADGDGAVALDGLIRTAARVA